MQFFTSSFEEVLTSIFSVVLHVDFFSSASGCQLLLNIDQCLVKVGFLLLCVVSDFMLYWLPFVAIRMVSSDVLQL
jgi:hypothetical protein